MLTPDEGSRRQRVRKWVKEEEAVAKILAEDGPKIIRELWDKFGGLRVLSRKCGLSPTYLSRVYNRIHPISPKSFLLLSEFR